jgi:hypothetical protein
MIEFGPKRQKKILVQQNRNHPLMAEDIGHVLGMILMPPTSRDLFAGLLKEGVIHDKKENIADGNAQLTEELIQSRFPDLIDRPNVVSQESRETGKGSP